MKIAILYDELAPGSAPKVIGQTFKGLEALGHVCKVYVLIDNRQKEKFASVYDYHLSGVKIKYIFGVRPFWDFKFPGFSFFSLHHILSFFIAPLSIQSGEFDVVVANCQYSAFAAWGIRLLRGIPYILYIHCDPCTHTLKKTYFKTWLRIFYPVLYLFAWFLDKLATELALVSITSGELHQNRFRKITKKPLENLRLGCFSSKEFTPYSQREKAIVSFDRWDIGNYPDIFLELAQNIKGYFKIKIGGFWHPESIKENFLIEIRERKLESMVEVLGPLDENAILDLCSHAMLHVHPNEEAFGMQTLEAAACGCCIIVPKGSGVADLFKHGIHGYFPDDYNLSQFIKYTNLIFEDKKKTEEMGYEAWKTAKNYTWENFAKSLEAIVYKYAKYG